MFIERKSCPICESKNICNQKDKFKREKIIEFLENYYNRKLPEIIYKEYEYKIIQCDECKLVFQKFICDNKLSDYLYENLIDKNASLNKKKNLSFIDFQEYILDMSLISNLFQKKSKDIKILEFGTGWGFWSRLAKSFNYEIEGIEISESRINYLSEYKINVTKKIDQKKKYDFIYSNQVFEHLANPKEEFSKLLSVLNQNSYFLIKVPSSFLIKQKDFFKKFYYKDVLFPLEHINLYNKEVFNFLCKKYNLTICNNLILKTKTLLGIKTYIKNYFTSSFVLFRKN